MLPGTVAFKVVPAEEATGAGIRLTRLAWTLPPVGSPGPRS